MKEQPSLRYAWYVLGILLLAYISSFIDRQILALLVKPIKASFGISDTQMGLLMGLSFALFYTVLGIPIGVMADRMSRKKIIGWGIAIWSLMTALCGVAGSFSMLFLARVGVGIGEAALSPAAYSMISDYFPKKKLGTALGIYNMGVFLGSGLSILIGAAIRSMVGQENIHLPFVGEIFSWQVVFFYIGLPGFLIVLLLQTIKEPKRKELDSGKESANKASFSEIIAYFKANKSTFLSLNFGMAFMSFASFAGTYWIPTFLNRVHGWTDTKAGVTFGVLVSVFSTLGVVLGGRYADHLLKKGIATARMRTSFMGMSVAVISTAGLLFANPDITLVFIALFCFASSFSYGSATAAIQEIVPNNMRAIFSAFFLFVVNLIGLGLGPLSVGFFNDTVFADPQKINYSIFIAQFGGCIISSLLLYIGLSPFAKSTSYLKKHLADA
ncbi:MFS transporter [Emticicia sp. 21SJ11W-3]|uniref:spinster family MFS transporter n=1 Tax=Emticicia sp. 21SJ11W-3 TaxID=2916755 RepID=UPI00209F3BDF|nr:MFS transporter [Emticicia sp. 21SJ11W-3]UTA68887.1 MFS transporter [Emticicia sp. 21SJ11W-3]